jgi:hypothetical protein
MHLSESEDLNFLFDKALCAVNVQQVRQMITSGVDVNRSYKSGDTTPLML